MVNVGGSHDEFGGAVGLPEGFGGPAEPAKAGAPMGLPPELSNAAELPNNPSPLQGKTANENSTALKEGLKKAGTHVVIFLSGTNTGRLIIAIRTASTDEKGTRSLKQLGKSIAKATSDAFSKVKDFLNISLKGKEDFGKAAGFDFGELPATERGQKFVATPEQRKAVSNLPENHLCKPEMMLEEPIYSAFEKWAQKTHNDDTVSFIKEAHAVAKQLPTDANKMELMKKIREIRGKHIHVNGVNINVNLYQAKLDPILNKPDHEITDDDIKQAQAILGEIMNPGNSHGLNRESMWTVEIIGRFKTDMLAQS